LSNERVLTTQGLHLHIHFIKSVKNREISHQL